MTSGSRPTYPGEMLGLPESGPGSLAPMGRRLAALLIDWLISYGLAALALGRSGNGGMQLLPAPRVAAASLEGNTEQIGKLLFQNYVIPFEIASILLLVALVGAVVMGKKKI